MVIPDSHEVRPGIKCQNMPEDQALPVTGCYRDLHRVQLDVGYLREILQTLDSMEEN